MLQPLKTHQPEMGENLVMVSFYPQAKENSEVQKYHYDRSKNWTYVSWMDLSYPTPCILKLVAPIVDTIITVCVH